MASAGAGNGASVAKKAIDGLFVWFVASSILLGLSASVMDYSVRGSLAATGIADVLLDASLALFGAVGLLVSATLLYNVLRILRRYSLLPYAGARGLGDEEVVRLIKDVISLYRGYRWYIVLAGALLTATGVALMALAVEGNVIGGMGASSFRFAAAAIYFVYGVLDLYLGRRIVFRRLARAGQLEGALSRFIE